MGSLLLFLHQVLQLPMLLQTPHQLKMVKVKIAKQKVRVRAVMEQVILMILMIPHPNWMRSQRCNKHRKKKILEAEVVQLNSVGMKIH
jgi:hypothetical protein